MHNKWCIHCIVLSGRMYMYVTIHLWLSLSLSTARVGFRDSPPTPPSLSRQLESTKYHEHASSGCQQVVHFFSNSLKVLKNFYFLLYLIVAGGMLIFYTHSNDIVIFKMVCGMDSQKYNMGRVVVWVCTICTFSVSPCNMPCSNGTRINHSRSVLYNCPLSCFVFHHAIYRDHADHGRHSCISVEWSNHTILSGIYTWLLYYYYPAIYMPVSHCRVMMRT